MVGINKSNNSALTIKAIVYNTDGTEKLSNNALEIRGTWFCDLDLLIESGVTPDFKWDRKTIPILTSGRRMGQNLQSIFFEQWLKT